MFQIYKTRIMCIVLACSMIFTSCSLMIPVDSTDIAGQVSSPTTPLIKTSSPTTTQISVAENAKTPLVSILDNIFFVPKTVSTLSPKSSDLCKQVPLPQVVRTENNLVYLSGRFSLCVLKNGVSAIDLDTGDLVTEEDVNGDIQLMHGKTTLNPSVFYYLAGTNSAHIDEANIDMLNYQYCENITSSLPRPGIVSIREGTGACITTTEGHIAILRIEKIDH